MVGFVKTTGGKPELSARDFFENYIVKQKQDALVFQLTDPVDGAYPLFIDIDLDFEGKVEFDEEAMQNKHIETAAHIASVVRTFCKNGRDFDVIMSKRPGYYKGSTEQEIRRGRCQQGRVPLVVPPAPVKAGADDVVA